MDRLNNLEDNKKLVIPEINGTGMKGKLKAIVRRLVAFMLVPIVEKQNSFNNEVCTEIEALNHELKHVKPILEKNDFSMFAQYLERNDKLINTMEERIIILEKRIEQLEEEKNRGDQK